MPPSSLPPAAALFGARSARIFIALESPSLVRARFEIALFRASPGAQDPLALSGEGLAGSTQGAWLNGRALDWRALLSEDERSLTLMDAPDEAFFCCETLIELAPGAGPTPGLWSHNGRLGASCDPEGFHAIAWAPAALALDPEWACEIEAEAAEFPVLEANGILVDYQSFGTRRRVCYQDPEQKPARLFKFLAGPDLDPDAPR